jgi:hypothetical protein
MTPETPQYLVARLRRALTEDPRTAAGCADARPGPHDVRVVAASQPGEWEEPR